MACWHDRSNIWDADAHETKSFEGRALYHELSVDVHGGGGGKCFLF